MSADDQDWECGTPNKLRWYLRISVNFWPGVSPSENSQRSTKWSLWHELGVMLATSTKSMKETPHLSALRPSKLHQHCPGQESICTQSETHYSKTVNIYIYIFKYTPKHYWSTICKWKIKTENDGIPTRYAMISVFVCLSNSISLRKISMSVPDDQVWVTVTWVRSYAHNIHWKHDRNTSSARFSAIEAPSTLPWQRPDVHYIVKTLNSPFEWKIKTENDDTHTSCDDICLLCLSDRIALSLRKMWLSLPAD